VNDNNYHITVVSEFGRKKIPIAIVPRKGDHLFLDQQKFLVTDVVIEPLTLATVITVYCKF